VNNSVNTAEGLNRIDAGQTAAFPSGIAELEQIADRAMAAPSGIDETLCKYRCYL